MTFSGPRIQDNILASNIKIYNFGFEKWSSCLTTKKYHEKRRSSKYDIIIWKMIRFIEYW